jgi:predicted metallo-beta-lactamase superfamily hydrolase
MTHGEQAAGSVEVVNVSSRDQQIVWASDLTGQSVDFGRLPPTRAADGVVEGPPFAPDAERRVLM